MANRYVVFSHGKDSGPWGKKITALADVARSEGYGVESVDYRGIDAVKGRIDRLIEQAWDVMEREHVAYSNGRVVRRRIGTEVDEAGNERLDADGLPVPAYEDVLDDGPILSAVDRIRSLLDRRAKIFGYDAPSRSRIEVITEGLLLYLDAAEVRSLAADLFKAAQQELAKPKH